jgi:hypothetical protein
MRCLALDAIGRTDIPGRDMAMHAGDPGKEPSQSALERL